MLILCMPAITIQINIAGNPDKIKSFDTGQFFGLNVSAEVVPACQIYR